jgi:hypothetical protein
MEATNGETMGKMNSQELFSDNRNIIIMILSTLLILSILGVTFMNTVFDFIKAVLNYIVGFFGGVFGTALYSTGEVVNATSNTVADAAKTGIDLGNGAVNDIGNLLKSGVTGEPPEKINVAPIIVVPTTTAAASAPVLADSPSPTTLPPEPQPTSPENPIQQSTQAPKSAWCYVGSINGARNCIQVDPDKQGCQSGRLFSSANICVNP